MNRKLEFFLKNYLIELFTPYEGPVEGIVHYLKSHSQAGQTFFASFDHEAIFLYTGLSRVMAVPFSQPPDWIIYRWGTPWSSATCSQDRGWVKEIDSYLIDYLKKNSYEEIVLNTPNQKQENLPMVPDYHEWVTPAVKRPVVVYHHVGGQGSVRTLP